jgi:hypothetical protein
MHVPFSLSRIIIIIIISSSSKHMVLTKTLLLNEGRHVPKRS